MCIDKGMKYPPNNDNFLKMLNSYNLKCVGIGPVL